MGCHVHVVRSVVRVAIIMMVYIMYMLIGTQQQQQHPQVDQVIENND